MADNDGKAARPGESVARRGRRNGGFGPEDVAQVLDRLDKRFPTRMRFRRSEICALQQMRDINAQGSEALSL
ncbi:MAG: hypothetical protein E5X07_28805 [Mesorhizobium sp.]|uniref:hypothetical protein n=1 Tax=Mesorhizobium sp. M5C.F.Ca.IN.020.29.1.1 TaxID=2496770 RepID=UPI0012022DCD|nr:hypothetical protein [Mesorhizobium sp. M5C.F.Ca.IN.020.29.1.1]TIS19315.1 MAG: hypothetical protein E5X07_28805 [Mesorhizobium sp.]